MSKKDLQSTEKDSKLTRLYNKNPDGQLVCSIKLCEKAAAWLGKKYPLVVCEDHEQDLIDIELIMKKKEEHGIE